MSQRMNGEPVSLYVKTLPYARPEKIIWKQVTQSRPPIKTYTRTEAFQLERDGWQLPHVQDFDTLPKEYFFAHGMLGDYWTRDEYKTTPATPLFIGYNTTFQYPILRLESESLAVVLVQYC